MSYLGAQGSRFVAQPLPINPARGNNAVTAFDEAREAQEAVEARAATDDLDDPYRTCVYGHHRYRLVNYSEIAEECEYACVDCGDTDPEGNLAR